MIPLLLTGAALAADLEGNPTFGQYPGTAGLLVRPSRLGWEADPLVAVGASLDVGAPELDLSVRPEAWTTALVLALPADVDFEAASAEGRATREITGGWDPWIGVGAAKVTGTSAFGVSLVLDLAVDVQHASLNGFEPSASVGTPSTITWDGDVPSRGEGNAGRVSAQDLDLALTGGVARTAGDTRPRVDVLGRWLRSGEHIRVASGVAGTTGVGGSVDSVVGANPAPFWSLPNRSAAMLGVVGGFDRGGTLRDPRLRLEAAVEAGRTWPTFRDTRIVDGWYTTEPVRARITYQGGGTRLVGGIGTTWGWVADERDGARPGVRVRAGWRLDGQHELHAPETCVETACSEVADRTVYLRLTAPTALELRVSERVTTSAGLVPTAYGYRWHRVTSVEGGVPAELMEQALVVGLGVRGGVRYEHRGWVLGAGFSTSGSIAGAVGLGGYGNAPAPFNVRGPPTPDSDEVAGPALTVSPRLWIGWRPGTGQD